MYSRVDLTKKNQFLDKTKIAREERAQEKFKECSIIQIQALIRRYLVRCRLIREIRSEIDLLLQIPSSVEDDYKPTLKPAPELFAVIRKFLIVMKDEEDKLRFEYLCKYVLAGMSSDTLKFQYVSLALNKSLVILWIAQCKLFLWKCCCYFKILKAEKQTDMRMITTCLHVLITFTNSKSWKVVQDKKGEALQPGMVRLCNNIMGDLNSRGMYPCLQAVLLQGLSRSKPIFKSPSLTACVTMAMRPLIAAEFSTTLMTSFLLHIFSVPALVEHIFVMSQECLAILMTHRVFKRSLDILSTEQNSLRIIFNALEGNYALCLLANLIHLGTYEMEGLVENTRDFMFVVSRLLESCKIYVQGKKSNLTHWHPVLGWFAQKTDQGLHDAMPFVVKQLKQLWSMKMMRLLFDPLFAYADHRFEEESGGSKPSTHSQSKNLLKKAFEKASTKNTVGRIKLDSPVLVATCSACGMYLTAINTLSQLKLEILAGLCYQDVVLPKLWLLIHDTGSQKGLKPYLDLLTLKPNYTKHPLFDLLQLSCVTSAHIITILDEVELYEQCKPFPVRQLISMSSFLNHFIFRVIWHELLGVQEARTNDVFQAVHALLMILYERDCRRSYTPPDHWLIRDAKPSTFLSDLERGKRSVQFLLQMVPHIIPHKERVILFRRNVSSEKDVLGLLESACVSPQSTLITVHRSRIIEDGYRQLALLPVNALKGLIRVKFINEQGLDEAGIDQDGVFKEFLEETIKRVFDPSLNLFRVTSEQKLYPSPTSYIQENHLQLFEFVGRMLAKAVYEGIVVDVPFAPFFLSQILGHTHSSTYSSLDELPSLDPELYKSLTYVKHYDGDLSDLDLTFSYDEDCMGKLINHELIPGGKALAVTNENKINYVHLMAHFKLRGQIREQTSAFIHGFRSIINMEWLQMFSTPELQKLMSGETGDIDLEDLRKHTQYYGGFHNNHRVINWLWETLEKDFTAQERALFLKFITSCSKSPLLGFAHLEPPFSIRCVEVSDEQDTGDTVGSVLKGFFNIRKKDPVGRLPTSSTCFNLLKLPNYQKKSTLREKLRYAITSNTGFELS